MKGSDNREVSTTMVFVRLITLLSKNNDLGKNIVPIIPDEARTFGIDPLFRELGIYSHVGQKYDPVDSEQFYITRKLKMVKYLKRVLVKQVPSHLSLLQEQPTQIMKLI